MFASCATPGGNRYLRQKLKRKKAEEEREKQAAELRKACEQAARDHGPVLLRHLHKAVLADLDAFNNAVAEDERFIVGRLCS